MARTRTQREIAAELGRFEGNPGLRRLTKWLVLAAVLLGIGTFALPPLQRGRAALARDPTERRVKAMLQGMSGKTDTTDHQTAICLYEWERYMPPGDTMDAKRQELQWAYDRFDAWLKHKALKMPISSYEVVELLPVTGAGKDVYRVTVNINGTRHRMDVTPKKPIKWVD